MLSLRKSGQLITSTYKPKPDIVFRASDEPGKLERALKRICQYAEDAVIDGYSIIFADRPRGELQPCSHPSHAGCRCSTPSPDPAKVCVRNAALWSKLVMRVLNAPQVVNPTRLRCKRSQPVSGGGNHRRSQASEETRCRRIGRNTSRITVKALNGGLLKIFSKWDFDTAVLSRCTDFEALGISKAVVDKYFTGHHHPYSRFNPRRHR